MFIERIVPIFIYNSFDSDCSVGGLDNASLRLLSQPHNKIDTFVN